ncbi:MAG: N-acetyltransferase [Candidatus Heimdallarchaeota archaeon]|nr:N-acetyltransferase [Candidatus Heimdallarchaeota archaeon]
MAFRDFKDSDKATLQVLLSNINLSALETWNTHYPSAVIKKCLIYESETNAGQITAIELDDQITIYLSFLKVVKEKEILDQIKIEIMEIISRSDPNNNIIISVWGKNENILSLFDDKNFQVISSAILFRYTGQWPIEYPDNMLKELDLCIKPFSENAFDQYINLLDDAFEELLLRNNRPLRPHSIHRKRILEGFKVSNELKNFYTLWNHNELIGLYILENNHIDMLAIHPRFQNMKYGTLLLKHSLNLLITDRKNGEVYLYIQKMNTKAQKFYQNRGFEEISEFMDFLYQEKEEEES